MPGTAKPPQAEVVESSAPGSQAAPPEGVYSPPRGIARPLLLPGALPGPKPPSHPPTASVSITRGSLL